jgi:methyltransferase (TIGR00027 family)
MKVAQLAGALAIILLAGLPDLRAVEPEKPSKTSIWVQASRAVGAHDPDPSVRNPDWLAEIFLGPDERAQIPDNYMILALDQDYRVAMKDPRVSGLVRAQTVRTKFMDEHMLKAVEGGAVQLVNLGAGFDSRAYRFRSTLRNVRIFEVDYGPTQEYKRRRATAVIGPAPANLVYVPIDFTRQKLGDVLQRAGYRRDRKTFFIWEGVTMYIPNDAVLDTLRFIAGNSAPGSAVVFDYYPTSRLNELPKVLELEADMQAMVKGWDEPWIFGIPDGTTRAYVASTGMRLTEEIASGGPEAVQRYLTRKDGTRVGELPWPLPPPLLGEGRYGYYYAVATVPQAESRSRN